MALANHLSSDEDKNEWRYISAPALCLNGTLRGDLTFISIADAFNWAPLKMGNFQKNFEQIDRKL
jgi:hypothetical protein